MQVTEGCKVALSLAVDILFFPSLHTRWHCLLLSRHSLIHQKSCHYLSENYIIMAAPLESNESGNYVLVVSFFHTFSRFATGYRYSHNKNSCYASFLGVLLEKMTMRIFFGIRISERTFQVHCHLYNAVSYHHRSKTVLSW